MTDKPYVPSTEDVRRSYVYAESSSFHAIEPSPKDTPFQRECESPVKVARKRDTEEYRAAREEFDQWLDHVHAEAKQEGLAQGWTEGWSEGLGTGRDDFNALSYDDNPYLPRTKEQP